MYNKITCVLRESGHA